MAKFKGAIVVDTERCKGCDVCVSNCPFDVLRLSKDVNTKGYTYSYMLNPDNCTGCASCGYVCPDGCIQVYRVKEEKE